MASNDLSTRIRLDVERGRPRDEIVAGLVEGGLSKPSAERFVDRAIAARDVAPTSLAPPQGAVSAAADTDHTDDAGGRRSLISGAFWLSLGSSVTGITYLLAKPGGKYMLAYGAVIVGLVAFGRGLLRFWSVRPEPPFPWKAVAIAGLVPLVGMAGIVGYARARDANRRAAAQQAADGVTEARARQARAAEERASAETAAAASKATEQARAQEKTQEQTDRVNKVLDRMRTSPDATTVCNATHELVRLGARETIPDLRTRLADGGSVKVQACAAGALVNFGEVEGPLAFYVTSAQSSDSDARRLGLLGFGGVGPTAFATALPFLTTALQSPDRTQRYWALQALARMGPEAAPLLRTALNDRDPMAKSMAADALAKLGPQP